MSDPFAFLSPNLVSSDGGHTPLLRSPIERTHLAAGATLEESGGWRVASYDAEPGDAWLADISHTGKIDIRGDAARMDGLTGGAEPGRAGLHEGVWTARISPTRGVAFAPADRVRPLMERIGPGATDMTCGWAGVVLGGPALREVFMRSSALDVRERVFPAGRCAASSVMRVPTIVLNEGDAFRMYVGWEYGEYFWEAILDAGQGVGIRPVSAAVALREQVTA